MFICCGGQFLKLCLCLVPKQRGHIPVATRCPRSPTRTTTDTQTTPHIPGHPAFHVDGCRCTYFRRIRRRTSVDSCDVHFPLRVVATDIDVSKCVCVWQLSIYHRQQYRRRHVRGILHEWPDLRPPAMHTSKPRITHVVHTAYVVASLHLQICALCIRWV